MNDTKIKTIPKEEVVKRVAAILKKAIESGHVSNEYIKLHNAKIDGDC